jgi:anthranilate phosphoribosyltransferase
MLKPYLAKVAAGTPLTEAEAEAAFRAIMAGEATPAQMGGFLMALRVRGETVEEITGAVRAMRSQATPIQAPADAIDIVGTGGDLAGTLNISTAAALVVASCGVPVAKHGNRALTSKCGSADVLAALGVEIDAEPVRVTASIAEAGFGFLLAPRYHPAMRNVAGVRGELGTRTIFNLLGPLANPAGVRRQFSGAFARHWVKPMAQVLGALGSERAWVVHGSDGLDELTLTGPSTVAEYDNGRIHIFEVAPRDVGLRTAHIDELRGADPATNAAAIRALLRGEPGAFRDAVLFNAAAALVVAGRVETLRDGVTMAAEGIDSGRAQETLARVVAITAGEQPASGTRPDAAA